MPSASDVYPDGDNLLARIAEIQEIIVTTSKAVQTPRGSVDNFPFWLTVIRSIVPEEGRLTYRQLVWPFEVEMILFRGQAELASKNLGMIQQINTDLITTVRQFSLRKNLETPTYPDPPDGFVADSVRIQGLGYTEDDSSGFAGSSYTMQFRYEIFQSIAAIEGITD